MAISPALTTLISEDKSRKMKVDPSSAEFFVVAQPGLEDLVQSELREWAPQIESIKEHGGVSFFAPLEHGLGLNLCLKTATRILVRVARFRCRDFPKLYKAVESFDWSAWLKVECELDVQASTRVSRLKIKKRIEETCLEGWRSYQRAAGIQADRDRRATLYVRLVEDICTFSLDTSGERLHKRGDRQWIGAAPLRESIAAALVQWVSRDFGAGVEQVEVIDPMMGSGTFLIEAASRGLIVDHRDFAFDNFARQPSELFKRRLFKPQVHQLIGIENDLKTLQAAHNNLRFVGEQIPLQLLQKDIFLMEPLPSKAYPRWIFVNPPYGERLQIEGSIIDYYQRLFAACEKVIVPDRACFLLPAKSLKGRFILPPAWKVLAKRPFLNGGIPVVAFVFGRL